MCRVELTQRSFLGQGEFKQKPVPLGEGKERQEEGEILLWTVALNSMCSSVSKHKWVQSNEHLCMCASIQMSPVKKNTCGSVKGNLNLLLQEIHVILMSVCQSCNQTLRCCCWDTEGNSDLLRCQAHSQNPPGSSCLRKYLELGQQELGKAGMGAFRKDHKETRACHWQEKYSQSIILHNF